jgi:hypothetical protein
VGPSVRDVSKRNRDFASGQRDFGAIIDPSDEVITASERYHFSIVGGHGRYYSTSTQLAKAPPQPSALGLWVYEPSASTDITVGLPRWADATGMVAANFRE